MAIGHENQEMLTIGPWSRKSGHGHGPLAPGHENLGMVHGPLAPGHENLGMGHVQACKGQFIYHSLNSNEVRWVNVIVTGDIIIVNSCDIVPFQDK